MNGRIILCADDYALTAGVSSAIRTLAKAGRISATSAIVTGPGWQEEAEALKPLSPGLAIGLHLNFTLGSPLELMPSFTDGGTFPTVGTLIRRAYVGRLRAALISAEISRQLDAFEAQFGTPPDFVDGHQHVHVLPVIRTQLLVELARRYRGRRLLVRDPSSGVTEEAKHSGAIAKSIVISALAIGMRRDIEAMGFVSNDGFAGITSFESSKVAVARDFRSAAQCPGSRPLVMCHPGFTDASLQDLDPVTQRRQTEFDVLMAANPLSENAWRPKRDATGCVVWPGPGGKA